MFKLNPKLKLQVVLFLPTFHEAVRTLTCKRSPLFTAPLVYDLLGARSRLSFEWAPRLFIVILFAWPQWCTPLSWILPNTLVSEFFWSSFSSSNEFIVPLKAVEKQTFPNLTFVSLFFHLSPPFENLRPSNLTSPFSVSSLSSRLSDDFQFKFYN